MGIIIVRTVVKYLLWHRDRLRFEEISTAWFKVNKSLHILLALRRKIDLRNPSSCKILRNEVLIWFNKLITAGAATRLMTAGSKFVRLRSELSSRNYEALIWNVEFWFCNLGNFKQVFFACQNMDFSNSILDEISFRSSGFPNIYTVFFNVEKMCTYFTQIIDEISLEGLYSEQFFEDFKWALEWKFFNIKK